MTSNPSKPILFTGPQPRRAHDTDAGYDLAAIEHATLDPGARRLISTGMSLVLPDNHAGLVVPRSGLAVKHGVTVLNSPGVIDWGYRGIVKVALVNHGDVPFHVAPGDRIAQLLVVPVVTPRWERVGLLPSGDRGDAGFGSTGL